jgi:hypothetical protein
MVEYDGLMVPAYSFDHYAIAPMLKIESVEYSATRQSG